MKTKEETLRVLRELEHMPMGKLLTQLFETETADPVPEEDSYGIQVQIVLAASNYACAGSLVVEPSGLLRIVQPGLVGDPNIRSKPPTPILAHHYLHVHQIGTLIVVKPLKSQRSDGPKIVT